MARILFLLVTLLVTVAAAQAFNVEKLIMDGASQLREAPAHEEEPREPQPRPAPSPASHQGAPSAAEDDHFIQHDDYFFAEHGLGNRAWIYVKLAKMTTPPSAQTKDEAEFFKISDGTSHWSRHFWKTRIARPDEIQLGATMIIFEGRSSKGVYQAPDKKGSARRSNWFMAKITDTSDLYKGFVTVSGGYKVAPNNLRVLVR